MHPLSTRHAEVLVLLAYAGPAGMDAAALSEALYGDREHLVTVRAEMSRLRKSLGGLLQARPYRIAPGVEVVLPDPVRIPGSTAPGLRPSSSAAPCKNTAQHSRAAEPRCNPLHRCSALPGRMRWITAGSTADRTGERSAR